MRPAHVSNTNRAEGPAEAGLVRLEGARATGTGLNRCKDFQKRVNGVRLVTGRRNRGRRVTLAGLCLATAGFLLLPAGAFAEDPVAAQPAPSASPTAAPLGESLASTPPPAPLPSPTASPAPAKHQTLQNRQAQGELIGDLTAAEAHALMLERSLKQSELSLIGLGQKILDSQKQVRQLDSRIAQVMAQHQQVSARLKTERAQLSTVVRQMYKHQNNFFVSLVQAGGFGGLLQTLGYSDVLVDRERNLVRAVQADDVALAHSEATLQRSRSKKQGTLSGLELARTSLVQAIAREQALQIQLQGTIDEALAALDAMQNDTPEMAAKRAKLVRMKTDSVLSQIEQAVFAQQNFQRTAHLIAEDPILTAGGPLLWPIPHATITQGFGPTPYFFEAAYAGFPHFHTGIDLAVPLGTPVFAAADGVVALARPMTDAAGDLIGYGNYVILQHQTGLKTLYGHLLAIGVKEGDVVKRGQLVGLLGSTGNSTGPHTHFEVRIENSPVDPMQMLPAGSLKPGQ
jgi:murein DD-endopeptidase MepM/ murein hydrolase activator NlpD